MNLLIVLYILFTHFVADFIMQSDEMAKGKSTSIYWLTKHMLSYGFTMLGFGFLIVIILALIGDLNSATSLIIIGYVFVNMTLHWVTDYFTSKQVKKYFDVQDFHNGFVVIGLDQFIHATCLLGTYWLMFL